MDTILASGKCPKCDEPIRRALIEDLPAARLGETQVHKLVSTICPHCRTILSVSPRPL
jgi:hypothetical protein